MKTIKRISNILKVSGIVLVILSLVLAIYALAAGGANRNALLNHMRSAGLQTSIIDSLAVDHTMYQAMSVAVQDQKIDSTTRAQLIFPLFSDFEEKAKQATLKAQDENAAALIAWFDSEFDHQAFADHYAQLEDQSENRAIAEVIEYLDSLTALPPKAGKKLPALQVASCADWFHQYYDQLISEHGEETGTYLEFLEYVKATLEAAVATGEKVTSAKDYFNTNFAFETYLEKLPEIQRAERSADQANILDLFASMSEKKIAGERVDFVSFFNSLYADISARYPTDEMLHMSGFLTVMQNLLQSNSYDGTVSSTMTALRTARDAENKNSFSSKLTDYCDMLVKSADDQAPVPAFAILWMLVANYILVLCIGIILIALAKVLTVILTKRLLAKREAAGIQEDPDVLLRVEHLKQYFRTGDFVNRAVDDISFFVKKGEVFGLVGESGCGKTTTGRTIINLYDPTEGDVYFQGLRISSTQNGMPVLIKQLRNEYKENVEKLKGQLKEEIDLHPEQKSTLTQKYRDQVKEMKSALTKRINEVRDNALESSVEKSKCIEMYREKRKAELTATFEKESQNLSGQELAELKKKYDIEMKVAAKDSIMPRMQMIFQDPIASINPRMTVREIIAEGLVIRGIRDKAYIDRKVNEMLELVGLVPEHADRYPHEFSGGQRQRIGIARAIVMEPDLIIADEPISALDVSIQAQVINLLNDLRNKMGLTILFIAHNLSVVKYFSDRIAVMYFGRIMELTTSDELFEHPLHPYTKSLLSAIPYPDPHYEKQRVRIEYNPAKAHDYSVDQPSLREIKPGHYVHCNDAEFEKYKKELGM